jgi:hypothetical protein
MSLIADSSIFIINSADRISGTDSNFQYIINMPKNSGYDRVCMLQALIPKSYYLVASPFNTFILSESGVQTTVTVTPGNYNVRSWITLLGALLTSSSSHGYTYTITFPNSLTDVDTGKFTYTVTGNVGVQPSIIFPVTSELYEQFGFSASSTNTFSGSTLTSANVVKFQVEDVLFIHSDISYNNDQSSYHDVLQEIFASSTPMYSNIVYQNNGAVEAYSKRLLSAQNNTYRFTITDEQNRAINLNGLNCVFTIVCYNKDNINQLIASDILRKRSKN